MEATQIISIIMSGLTMLSIMFAVFHYFKNPQLTLEKKQIINDERDKNKATLLDQKEVENKALVLEKQFQWYMDSNNKKFDEMGKRLDDSFLLAANHTKTVDTKVTKLSEEIIVMGNSLTRLSTIIEERMPCRKG